MSHKKLNVAVSQFPVCGDLDTNAGFVERHIRQAAQRGCDVVLFPETGLTGYAAPGPVYGVDVFDLATLDGYDWDYAGHAVGLTYWVAEGFQGRGIVTRACRELVTRAFATPGVRRVEVSVATHNHRSRRLAERLGFQLEGVLRSELKQGDDICDLAVYSLLAHEWQRPLDHGTLPQ